MTELRGRCPIMSLVLLTTLAAFVFASSPRAQGPALSPELEKVRAALEKYQDPYAAVHDGYFSTVGCVHYPQPGGAGRVPYPSGGMGVHFLNPQLIGPVPDALRPPILVYEPSGDKLRLGLHHYDLHAWLWKPNPAGMFSPTNPAISCAGYGYSLAEEAPHIVPHP